MRKSIARARHALLLLSLVLCATGTADDELFEVMEAELDRSMAELQLGDLEKPYFLSYRIEDRDIASINGRLGGITANERSRGRTLVVEVRVGSPDFDNSNFTSGRGIGLLGGTSPLPLDDNPKEIRRRLWLATDAAYKRALETLAGKRAALQNMLATDEIPDFSASDPFETEDDLARATPDFEALEGTVRDVSAVFRETPEVTSSNVRATWNGVVVHFLDSEGSRFHATRSYVAFAAAASAQASDGVPLADSFSPARRRQLGFGHAGDAMEVETKEGDTNGAAALKNVQRTISLLREL